MPKKPSLTEQQKIAAMLGIEMPEPALTETESPEEISRQAEATLAYSTGHGFIRKECKSCGQIFAHTPGAVAYCSDTCRAASLLKIGIQWHWGKPASERWAYAEEPLVVPPKAMKMVDELTDVYNELKCPVHNHMRDQPEHGAWCWEKDEFGQPVPIPTSDSPVVGAEDTSSLDLKMRALGIG